jgi:hypothetical protein
MWSDRTYDRNKTYHRVICLNKPDGIRFGYNIEIDSEYMVEYEVCDLGSFGKCIMCYVFDIDTKEYLGCGYSRDFINVAKMRRNKLNEILED